VNTRSRTYEEWSGKRLKESFVPAGAGDCWPWLGAMDGDGYGIFRYRGRHLKAHKAVYEKLVGPVPAGRELDHTCCNRRCVNPAHLEPVTHRENILRGDTLPAKNAAKTHCDRGHEFIPGNTYMTPRGFRQCRACGAENTRKYRRAANVARS
jgi:hypothetical protein